MADTVDVIVVGAGPGGSSAAAAALRHGLDVAQIDRLPFPRVKPCGGGVTIRSCRTMPPGFDPPYRGQHSRMELNLWGRRVNRFRYRRGPLLRMVERSQFDDALVKQNLQSSAFRFFGGERVTDTSYDGSHFHVVTSRRRLRARHLVGADGAYSMVNRMFGVTQPRGFAVAVEVVLPRETVRLDEEVAPTFDFGAVEAGYGWVFPKDDHWNVGLYTLGRSRNLRESLTAYIEQKGFRVEGDPLATFVAHQFPYGGYRVSVPRAPVYIVGDAGGFGDAITGEGIYYALESGRIAGEAIHDRVAGRADVASYYRRIRGPVLADTFFTYHLACEFYSDIERGITLLENPLIWRPFIQGQADGATSARIIGLGGWLLLRSLVARTSLAEREGVSSRLALRGPLRGLPGAVPAFAAWLARRCASRTTLGSLERHRAGAANGAL